jgi:hypothetical protein
VPFTVRVNVVEWVADAPVPVTVIGYVPPGVLDAVVTVSVEEAPELIGLGLKPALAPDGSPDADSETLCALPAVTAVEIVDVADAPAFTVAEDGESDIEKSLVGTPPDSDTSSYSV